jgi:hypothetical protein
MKRKKFLLLFGILLILTVNYAGWCARQFFMHPKIERGLYVTDEAWAAIEGHFAAEGFPIPRFNWGRYCHCLMHPYEEALEPAQTWFKHEDEIYVYHRGTSFLFRRTNSDHWKSYGAI